MNVNHAIFSANNHQKLTSKNKHFSVLNDEKFASTLLAKFFIWLKEQISTEQFSIETQKLIFYNPSCEKLELIFILPEAFERYHQQTGIPAKIIQSELKLALKINYAYTFVKDEKIIEIFPCKGLFKN